MSGLFFAYALMMNKVFKGFNILCVLIGLCLSNVTQALQCSYMMRVTSEQVDQSFAKVLTEHELNRAEIVEFFKNFSHELMHRQANSNMLIAQTAYLSRVSAAEVFEYFRNFPETGLKRSDAAHNILVQTAFLTGRPALEVIELFQGVPMGVKGYSNDTARAFIMQTSIFAKVNNAQVIEFLEKAPRLPYDKRSMTYHLIIQTAFLTGKELVEVAKDFRSFPYTSLGTQTAGLDVLKQTALYADR